MKISTMIFDLDDTLYASDSGVWQKIRERIALYMVEKLNYNPDEVDYLREKFFIEYGTTLRGLQITRKIDPLDYLDFVHQLPIDDLIVPNPSLKKTLLELPYRKVVFTNSDRFHSQRVLARLGIEECFDQIVDVIDVAPYCKPMEEAFQKALELMGINNPSECIMIEDSRRNLEIARKIGMLPVQIDRNYKMQNGNGWLTLNSINEIEKIFQRSAPPSK